MAGSAERYQLSCIKEPGSANCIVKNEYDNCDGPGGERDFDYTGSRDRIKKQTLIDGQIINYAYLPVQAPCRSQSSVTISQGGTSRTVSTALADFSIGNVGQVKDELNRTTNYEWGGAGGAFSLSRNNSIIKTTMPEGNKITYTYDGRGNATTMRQIAKPGATASDILSSAEFPVSCSNPKTCNKPTSVTDPNGNATHFTYDSGHGGVLKVTGPAVGGVQSVLRYSYGQYYAWLKAPGGGYVQAATPVWLRTEERTCRLTATVGNACAGGAADEVVTVYEYQAGNSTVPSNLWLKGVVVTAGNQTRRTCYGYDEWGRKVSETKPAAGLTVCPQ